MKRSWEWVPAGLVVFLALGLFFFLAGKRGTTLITYTTFPTLVILTVIWLRFRRRSGPG